MLNGRIQTAEDATGGWKVDDFIIFTLDSLDKLKVSSNDRP